MNVSPPKKMHAVKFLGHEGLDKLCYRNDVDLPRMGGDNLKVIMKYLIRSKEKTYMIKVNLQI